MAQPQIEILFIPLKVLVTFLKPYKYERDDAQRPDMLHLPEQTQTQLLAMRQQTLLAFFCLYCTYVCFFVCFAYGPLFSLSLCENPEGLSVFEAIT